MIWLGNNINYNNLFLSITNYIKKFLKGWKSCCDITNSIEKIVDFYSPEKLVTD